MKLPLSILDLSPIASGSNATEALRNTIDLARHAEALGASRYWLAEHHNAGSLACAAPEIMIGQVGAATRTIRVGAGGMMLPNHAPLKVAELFRVLGALFPGRVDLGLGRAAGTDPKTALVLRRGVPAEDFASQVGELLGYLDEREPPRGPFAPGIRAIPRGVEPPEIWILGSGDYGGAHAAANGLPFAFAHHINPREAETVLRAYRRNFRPSARCAKPRSMIALSVLCADTDATARDLEAGAALGFLRFARGLRDLPMPSVDEARAYALDDDDRALLDAQGTRGIIGTVDRVRRALLEIARQCEVDEVMAVAHIHDHALRKHSYTLLAEALAAG